MLWLLFFLWLKICIHVYSKTLIVSKKNSRYTCTIKSPADIYFCVGILLSFGYNLVVIHESWEKKNKTNKIQKNKVKKGLACWWQYCHIYDSWKAETEQKLFNWNKVFKYRVKRMKKKKNFFFEFLLFYFVEKGNSQQYIFYQL